MFSAQLKWPNKRNIFGIILFIITTSVLFLSCSKNKNDQAAHSEASAVKSAAAVHAQEVHKDVWTCPMHAQIRKDQPGQCPVCGMALVKADQADDGQAVQSSAQPSMPDQHAAFTLSTSRQQMIGVKFGRAEKKPLFKSIRVAGRLAFDPELYTAQNEYGEALRQLERVKDSPLPDVRHSAERMVQSAKLRLKILGLSDSQIARKAGSDDSESSLLLNKPGQQVWIYAEVYEMDLPNIQSGLSAEISAGFLGGKVLSGKVVSVDRVINPATRTAKARILVPEAKTLLRPESYVDVAILAPLGEQVTVPFDAVLDTGKQSWVFVVDDKNQFTPRLVTVKLHAGDDVAVASGLKGGEKIVTSANFLIDSESRLKGVAMTAQSEAGEKSKAMPACPKNQHWDAPMAMCMPN